MGGGGLGEDASIAGRAAGGVKHGKLPLPLRQRAGDQRNPRFHAGGVHQIACREIIRPVENQIVIRQQIGGDFFGEPAMVGPYRDKRIQRRHFRLGGKYLGRSDGGILVDDLPLQVRVLDHVIVNHADCADTGRREVLQRGRAQPPGAHHKHARLLQCLLPRATQFAQHDMPGIPVEFGFRELVRR